MEGLENNQNTAGEAGTQTQQGQQAQQQQEAQPQIKIDESFLDNLANAISKRQMKVENSIVNDNLSKLPDEEREQAIALWNERKAKEQTKAAEAQKAKEKELETLRSKVAEYEKKEKETTFKQNSMNVFKEMNITEESKIKLISDLAGDRLFECTSDDGNFDNSKAKALFEDITTKYNLTSNNEQAGSLLQISAKKQEAQVSGDGLDKYRKMLGIKK